MYPRTTALLVAIVAILVLFAVLAPLQAQVETQPEPTEPTTLPLPPGQGPAGPSPLGPSPTPVPSPLRPFTGRVDLEYERLSDFGWKYRLINGSDASVGSVHVAVPGSIYDSRVVPNAPAGWLSVRQPGEGPYKGWWMISALCGAKAWALGTGRVMDLDLKSGAPMMRVSREARMVLGALGQDRTIYPWDPDFLPLTWEVPAFGKSARREANTIAWPIMSSQDVPRGPRRLLPEVVRRRQADVQILGQGRHTGEAFVLVMRTPYQMVVELEPGTVMVPDVAGFDDMIVGRAERLIMTPRDVATIRIQAFSITYGRKAPPTRLQDNLLGYQFADSHRFLDAYRTILRRAAGMRPRLYTPVYQDLPDLVVQWALWRQERILEGNPLDIRDVERDLTLYYRWVYDIHTPGQMRRDYLNPLQVRGTAREIWHQTDSLLYGEASPAPLP